MNGVQSVQRLPPEVCGNSLPTSNAAHRERRRDQQVVVAVEQVHVHAERAALLLRVEQLVRGDLLALRGDLDAGPDRSAPCSSTFFSRNAAPREPVRAEDRRRVLEAGMLLLDLRAQVLEDLDCAFHDAQRLRDRPWHSRGSATRRCAGRATPLRRGPCASRAAS